VRVQRKLTGASGEPVALTIGNFDGVHRGHQAMLARLIEAAEDLRLPPAVMTFEPHPREFFAPTGAPPRQWVLVGDDFRFGRGRQGDLAFLRATARRFSVEAMRTVEVAGERASSTAVRNALAKGELAHAAALLGRNYAISGHVGHGDKRGRGLGFPTANVPLRGAPPLTGIFTVRVHGLPGGPRAGVASVGVRPTVKTDGKPLLEVFMLDFDETIYGKRITVEFLHKLRDEARFPDVETLVRQIGRDVADAREYFAVHG